MRRAETVFRSIDRAPISPISSTLPRQCLLSHLLSNRERYVQQQRSAVQPYCCRHLPSGRRRGGDRRCRRVSAQTPPHFRSCCRGPFQADEGAVARRGRDERKRRKDKKRYSSRYREDRGGTREAKFRESGRQRGSERVSFVVFACACVCGSGALPPIGCVKAPRNNRLGLSMRSPRDTLHLASEPLATRRTKQNRTTTRASKKDTAKTRTRNVLKPPRARQPANYHILLRGSRANVPQL